MTESLFLICRPQACNFIKKETLAQVFSCEISKNFKNYFLYRTPLVAASVHHIVTSHNNNNNNSGMTMTIILTPDLTWESDSLKRCCC